MNDDTRHPVILDIDGPRDPLYVAEVAEAFAQSARVLAHLTRDREALHSPAEVYALILELSRGVSALPQICEQAGGWLEAAAVTEALDHAAGVARELGAALDAAANAAAGLDAAEDGDG